MLVGLCHILCLLTDVAAAQSAAGHLILWTGSDRRWGPGLAGALRGEISQLTVRGFARVDLNTEVEPPASQLAMVVFVQLLGECNTQSDHAARRPGLLGYVMETDGTIAPRMSVSCDAILTAIKPLMRELPRYGQNRLFARALVRVIQHELRHILEQTADHLSRGIYKPYLNPIELIVPAGSAQ